MSTAPRVRVTSKEQYAAILKERIRREMESLRLYRPRPEQLPFHLSMASERLVRGGVRSGKTIATAAEVASAATRMPIIGPDDKPLPFKYPTDRPLLIWIIGFDQDHIGRMHRKLFRRGLFKIIKDKQTDKFRAWRPWEADDAAREGETKPSAPLIPPRFIKPDGWAWESQKHKVFNICYLKNGTEIHAFPSGAEPGVGDAVDLIWIDEDVKYPSHIPEWQSRLSDVRGRLIWSSWPRTANEGLLAMSKRAEDEASEPAPDVSEIVLTFSGNPYIPADEKRKRLKGWSVAGDAVLRARDLGEFAIDAVLVFPTYNKAKHAIPSLAQPDEFEKLLEKMRYEVPKSWTHYLSVDPGHTHAAAILAAVPPPDIGPYIVVYGEVYLEGADADDMAKEIAARWPGTPWEAFVIDYRAGRQAHGGVTETLEEQYADAFRAHGLQCRRTGSNFEWGSDDIAARNGMVRKWLRPRDASSMRFRHLIHETPRMEKEFNLYKKKVTRDDTKEDVVARDNHTMDALAYLASIEPDYVIPERSEEAREKRDAVRRFLDRFFTPKDEREMQTVYMGAGAAPQHIY